MNGDDIERSIMRGVREMRPDMLDTLMDELGLEAQAPCGEATIAETRNQDGLEGVSCRKPEFAREENPCVYGEADAERVLSRSRPYRAKRWFQVGLSAAAVLIIAVGILSVTIRGSQTFAVVGLDVNPSIEIAIDDGERVIHADALNVEAEAILDDVDLEGASLNTACYAVLGSMLTKGYISSDSNSILVSVCSSNNLKGKEIEQRLSEDLNAFMEGSEVEVAILGQYVEDSEELENFAAERGISLGKAWLVKKLLAADSANQIESSLLKLSTQELILLAQEKNIDAETSIGTSDTSQFISKEDAVAIALRKAGVMEKDALAIGVEFDCEDGKLVYEVDFLADDCGYEYVIDARLGTVISSETEVLNSSTSQTSDAAPKELPYSPDDDDDLNDVADNDDDDDDDDDARYDRGDNDDDDDDDSDDDGNDGDDDDDDDDD